MKYQPMVLTTNPPKHAVIWTGFQIEIANEHGAEKLAEELNGLEARNTELQRMNDNQAGTINDLRIRVERLVEEAGKPTQYGSAMIKAAEVIKAQGGLFGPMPSATHVSWTLEPNGSFVFRAEKLPDSIYADEGQCGVSFSADTPEDLNKAFTVEGQPFTFAAKGEIQPGVFTGTLTPSVLKRKERQTIQAVIDAVENGDDFPSGTTKRLKKLLQRL